MAALLTHIDVYRSDYLSLAAILPTALAETQYGAPELDIPLQLIATALADGGEPAVRLQQLCGAVTAKAVEDCLFYRDARLVSLNEVGGEPHQFGVGLAEFHQRAATRAQLWPQTMTTLSTHDTKRGEDVRARIGVLSQVPSLWAEFVARWEVDHPLPRPATGLFLWQNIFGVWPASGEVTDELRDRLHAYAEKSIREAALHTSWNDPTPTSKTVGASVGWTPSSTVRLPRAHQPRHPAQHPCRERRAGPKATGADGARHPDVYQGTELWDDSLVDPDNRRAVDYAARREALKSLQHQKIRIVKAALHARRTRPDTFIAGNYHPVLATGSAADHVVAFRRGDDVLVAVVRWTVRSRTKRLGRHRCHDAGRLVDRRVDRQSADRDGGCR